MRNLDAIVEQIVKHLAGHHDQKTHGRPEFGAHFQPAPAQHLPAPVQLTPRQSTPVQPKPLQAVPERHDQQIHAPPVHQGPLPTNHGLPPSVKLQPFQERAVGKIRREPAVLVYHGTGSGKTITSIAACKDVGGIKQIVVPAALRYNYFKELLKFKVPTSSYVVRSYQNVESKQPVPANITIVDEAQRMGGNDTEASKLPQELSGASGKIVFLSGTPIRNHPIEFEPILRVLARDRGAPKNAEEFRRRFIGERVSNVSPMARAMGVKPGVTEVMINAGQLARLVHGRVDYEASTGNFPTSTKTIVSLPMTHAQSQLYKDILSKNKAVAYKIKQNLPPAKSESSLFNAFMTTSRQLSNDPSAFDKRLQSDVVGNSPKMSAIVKDIKEGIAKNPRYKAVVFSNWINSGVKPVAEKLKELGIPTELFVGGVSDDARADIVKRYNKGDLKVLCISSAGAEGLDLKGTRQIHIMEPQWNQSKLDQVMGRGVRNNSHADLPPAERHVDIKLYTTSPADKYLVNLCNKKKQLVDQFDNILKQAGK